MATFVTGRGRGAPPHAAAPAKPALLTRKSRNQQRSPRGLNSDCWIVEMGQRRPRFRSALDPETVETIQAPHLPLLDPGGRSALAYGPEGQYSSKVQISRAIAGVAVALRGALVDIKVERAALGRSDEYRFPVPNPRRRRLHQ
jgi:hypothetical protein